MLYRSYARGGEKISEIGFGGEHLEGRPEKEVIPVVERVIQSGINIIDVFMSNPEVRTYIGKALGSLRKNVYIQGHLCSVWSDGQYKRSRDIDEVKRAFDDLLTRLKTDYIDIGMLHFIDSDKDFDDTFSSGCCEYAEDLKRQGVIKRIGFSSHNPIVSQRLVETGLFDIFMFSINPGFDMDHLSGDNVDALFEFGGFKGGEVLTDPLREKLYRYSEANGIGITVMKTLCAGRLLDAASSPFNTAMSVAQCMKYALDRPGVVSTLMGCRTVAEVDEVMKYYSLSESEKDYSAIISGANVDMRGKCMYCNHCLPCASNIDIAAVNKFLDLAAIHEVIPATVKAHYASLSAHASDCVGCGMCEANCPFGVAICERMEQAAKLFGK